MHSAPLVKKLAVTQSILATTEMIVGNSVASSFTTRNAFHLIHNNSILHLCVFVSSEHSATISELNQPLLFYDVSLK